MFSNICIFKYILLYNIKRLLVLNSRILSNKHNPYALSKVSEIITKFIGVQYINIT